MPQLRKKKDDAGDGTHTHTLRNTHTLTHIHHTHIHTHAHGRTHTHAHIYIHAHNYTTQACRVGKRERDRGEVINSGVSGMRDLTFHSCIILILLNIYWEPTPVEHCSRHSAGSDWKEEPAETSLCLHSLEGEAKIKPNKNQTKTKNKTHQPKHQAWEFPSTFTNISFSPICRVGEASVICVLQVRTRALLKIAKLASGSPRI